jgi:hypothetical protein
MITKPDIDTDFSQFNDIAEIQKRRSSDKDDCPKEGCPATWILERRVDRHREEIEELKALVKKNSADTSEILEIVTMGKNFFKVLGWLGTAIKTIAAVGVPIAAFLYWLKSGSKP